jgi:hypothetical protein
MAMIFFCGKLCAPEDNGEMELNLKKEKNMSMTFSGVEKNMTGGVCRHQSILENVGNSGNECDNIVEFNYKSYTHKNNIRDMDGKGNNILLPTTNFTNNESQNSPSEHERNINISKGGNKKILKIYTNFEDNANADESDDIMVKTIPLGNKHVNRWKEDINIEKKDDFHIYNMPNLTDKIKRITISKEYITYNDYYFILIRKNVKFRK